MSTARHIDSRRDAPAASSLQRHHVARLRYAGWPIVALVISLSVATGMAASSSVTLIHTQASDPLTARLAPAAASPNVWGSRHELSLRPHAAENDLFGLSAALSRDGHTALVGVPGRTVDGHATSGAAEVFRLTSGGWGPPTELSLGANSQGMTKTYGGQFLGVSVALDASGDVAVVGAPFRLLPNDRCCGAIEVFRFSHGKWGAPTELLGNGGDRPASDCSLNACPQGFGWSVAINDDGSTILAGSPYATVAGKIDAGAAFIFNSEGVKWRAPTELSLGSSDLGYEFFGTSVSLNAGGDTALVGDPGHTVDGKFAAGIAGVFRLSAGEWGSPTVLSLGANAQEQDHLGGSVSLSSDGHAALVGVPGRSTVGQSDGAAEVFRFMHAQWGAPKELSMGVNGGPHDDGLGSSVALSSAGSTAITGAPGRIVDGKYDAGAAEVFRYQNGIWSLPAELSLGADSQGGGPPGSRFGMSVALSGDGDTAIAGTYRTIDGKSYAGSAEVFTAIPNGVGVRVNSSGAYGSRPQLSSLSPSNPSIQYEPPAEASNVTGALTCSTSATESSPVSSSPYPVTKCRGLSDPGHVIVYEYGNSGYTVTLAHVHVSYTGPTTIRRAADETLSATLTSSVTGLPVSGRVLRMQIGRGQHTQSCVTPKTDTSGRAGCVIKHVMAWKSPNPARVWFDGDTPGPSYDYAPGYNRTPVTIIKS